MTTHASLRHVSAWLSDLATLCAGSQPLAGAKSKIAAYASLLADDFPAAAFTRASLQHVAQANRFFPSYAEIHQPLSAWWQDNRPAPRALPPPDPTSKCPLDEHGFPDRNRASQAQINEYYRNDWDDPASIRMRVQRYRDDPFALERLAFLVRKWAPQHLGLLPPQFVEAAEASNPAVKFIRRAGPLYRQSAPAPDEPPPRPEPRYLSAEQLDRINTLPNGIKRANPQPQEATNG